MNITRGPEVKRHELGFLGLMEADGTRYEVLVIPFKEYLGCGFMSMSGPAYLVVDGGEKTAYAFRNPPMWDYVHEKLIRGYRDGYGSTDAKNTAHLIAHMIGAAQDEAAQEQAEQEAPGEVHVFFPKCYGTAKVEVREGVTNTECLMCSLEDRCRKENEERKAHEEHVMYHYGEARLEEDEEDEEDPEDEEE